MMFLFRRAVFGARFAWGTWSWGSGCSTAPESQGRAAALDEVGLTE